MRINPKNTATATEMQREPGKLIERILEIKEPVVLTQHGKPTLVMVDCQTFEALEQKASASEEDNLSSYERKLYDELIRMVGKLIAEYQPEKIILFGSFAQGNVHENSDLDLVIIKKTKKRFWDRQKEAVSIMRPKIACDFFVYTPEEWNEAEVQERPFFTEEIKGKGKVVYDKAA
ncbi:MAG: type II toxin-antitoxin system prevent-host-death family antitoxin [Deltaproteobacteria bacterium]|nr:type II toxin-antitoxin system prevent-host-death family antitoxin [Deltaproteobacteria bacterium]